MTYRVSFYSLDTWDVEEVKDFDHLYEAKAHTRGRAYTVEVVRPRSAVREAINTIAYDVAAMTSLALFGSAVLVWARYLGG